MKTKILLLLCLFGLMAPIQAKHRNFTVSVYVHAQVVHC